MFQPHAHHVLQFLGTFVALWSISLIARGLLHRPRIGLTVGPRHIKRAPVIAGLIGLPLGVGIFIGGMWLRRWVYGPEADDDSGLTTYHAVAAGIVAFAAALAAWGLFADRAKKALRCPKCWYDMAGVASTGRLICPECGHDAKTTQRLQRTRRHWKLVTLAALIAFAGLLAPRFANISKGGLKSVLPTTAMIAAYWQLPDDWLLSKRPVDEWAMDERLLEKNSWAWQRAWHTSKMRSEIRSPTSLARLTHALSHGNLKDALKDGDFRSETYVFAARQLGSTDPQTRLQAFELHRRGVGLYSAGQGMFEELQHLKKQAAPQIIEHADEIARGLSDTNFAVVYETSWVLLSAKTHRKEVADAVLTFYPTLYRIEDIKLFGTEDIINSTVLLLASGEGDDRVTNAILARADDPIDLVARSVWYAMAIKAFQNPLDPKLLERTDRELREGTDNDRFTSAARIRLSDANLDQTLEATLLSIASTPGEKRAAALRAFMFHDFNDTATRHERQRMPLLNAAFTDTDAQVLLVALDWVLYLARSKQADYRQFLAMVMPLANHSDAYVQTSASQTIATIKQALEDEKQAAAMKEVEREPSIQPEPQSR